MTRLPLNCLRMGAFYVFALQNFGRFCQKYGTCLHQNLETSSMAYGNQNIPPTPYKCSAHFTTKRRNKKGEQKNNTGFFSFNKGHVLHYLCCFKQLKKVLLKNFLCENLKHKIDSFWGKPGSLCFQVWDIVQLNFKKFIRKSPNGKIVLLQIEFLCVSTFLLQHKLGNISFGYIWIGFKIKKTLQFSVLDPTSSLRNHLPFMNPK